MGNNKRGQGWRDTVHREFVAPATRVVCETGVAAVALAGIALIDWLAKTWLGNEALIHEVTAKKIIDMGHLIVLFRWLVGCAAPLLALLRTIIEIRR